MKDYYVYIMAKEKRSTMYVGVTSDLVKRVFEHKNGFVDSFTKKYEIKRLVYFEIHNDIEQAIKREKRLKKWYRKWKYEIIEQNNPEWQDLYEQIIK